MNGIRAAFQALPAVQQPDWEGRTEIRYVREELAELPALIEARDVDALRDQLAEAAAGRIAIVQAGDCAEDWAECTADDTIRKAGLLDMLAGVMSMITRRPVLRAGRLAGQFGKPRSKPVEVVHGAELPVYRGHMVNSPEPDERLRQPDPYRLLTGYECARTVLHHLGWGAERPRPGSAVWTSHEALLLDYELPLLRPQPDGRLLLASTHWPWVGHRTRQPDGAHIALLAAVANPVAVKIGPGSTANELVALCERLDPHRIPGRLTLIARFGAADAGRLLPPLVAAVRAAGHPVSWLTDPMHGNTVPGPDGLKTRLVPDLIREVVEFHRAVTESGGTAAGVHLEATPDAVTECADDRAALSGVGDKYTSLCDPRLNPRQAMKVAAAWPG
ncbi:3-deoxy-7-phosphoheptulonate synthase [Streptomyces boninensis]|uniref:3-deoxy-7-phosphoheptulonate synthase n=1 Tax=Streptomyces boninensis TaxID=2039455 RepID=UPI003B215696